jgi:hypothetical protein
VTSASLPHHQYCYVDRQFTRGVAGVEIAVWFAVRAHYGRSWQCHVMLECGAVYRDLPPHAISFTETLEPWTVNQAQLWNVYSTRFSLIRYDYLVGLDCICAVRGDKLEGAYLFTAVPEGDGFTERPEQAKEFMFVRLDNGRVTILPTNKIVFNEPSFTRSPSFDGARGLLPNREVWQITEDEG